MNAREEILARVRAALADVERPGSVVLPEPAAPSESAEPSGPAQGIDLVALFAERVADYRAVVHRCDEAGLADVIRSVLPAGATVVVPAGLSVDLPGAVVDDGLSAASLDDCGAVVTDARLGVAETGTIVLDHGLGQGRRAISLVPDLHVCVIRSEQVVADVPDAIAVLDPARPHTWISGPSATSDIELDRVEGVHGPRTLHVVILGPH